MNEICERREVCLCGLPRRTVCNAFHAFKVKGSTIRHHDFPRQFELDFLNAGYDPDTVGRALARDAHKTVHSGKGWGHGGPWNYQWEQFFRGTGDGPHFKLTEPYESIKEFLNDLRKVDPEIGDWPYKP